MVKVCNSPFVLFPAKFFCAQLNTCTYTPSLLKLLITMALHSADQSNALHSLLNSHLFQLFHGQLWSLRTLENI